MDLARGSCSPSPATTPHLGRSRLAPAQRQAMPWVVVAVSTLLLVWSSPHIVCRAAFVLGMCVLLAAAVGWIVSTLAARGARGRPGWSTAPDPVWRWWPCWASCSPRSTG